MSTDRVAESHHSPFSPLLGWYHLNKRDLPWRQSRDPYAILVSEVMLQQTRVDTVIPYYRDFLHAFPNLQCLAEAPLESVYERWAGLGYYRRARNLQRAAQEILQRGSFPDNLESLRSLPGVGAYTAAALASIAFNQPALALDGNAERVLSRLFGLSGEAGSTLLQRRIHEAATPFLPEQAGDFTQAVMELGATLCTPLRPSCPVCPLRESCGALAQDAVASIPSPKKRRASEKMSLCALDIRHQGLVLLEKSNCWPFLNEQWTPPLFPLQEQEIRVQNYLARHPGTPTRLGEIRHGITFRNLRVEIWRWQTEANSLLPHQNWHNPDSRLPRLTSKIVNYSV